MSELEFLLRLQQLPKLGSVRIRKLIQHCGSIQSCLRCIQQKQWSKAVPSSLGGIFTSAKIKQAQKILECCQKHKVRILHCFEQDYPFRLKQLPDAPLIIYVQGKGELSPQRAVAIVGTRKMSQYGQMAVEKLLSGLAHQNIHVYSGMAYGIDVEAHKQSLKLGIPTSAVLGQAFDSQVVQGNRKIAKSLQEQGCLITELAPGSPTLPINFPKRNRIIAGLVDVVVVVESGLKGGSLITANLANQYNREVMAVPTAINQSFVGGCNALIKSNRAHLLEDASDLCQLMSWESEARAVQQDMFKELAEDEQVLLALVGNQSTHFDYLAEQLNWSAQKLSLQLLQLEMKNFISSLGGNRYKRK